jgi:large subunit ribosomal protein L7/L12
MANLEKLAEELSDLTLLEAAELKNLLEEKWGVSAAAPMAMAAMPGAAAAGAGEVDEDKTEFDVVLTSMSDLGLKEAKDLVEGAVAGTPAVLMEGVPKEMADETRGKLEEEGGTVELK